VSQKTVVWIGATVGSTIGGFVPMLWHAPLISMSGMVASTVGGVLGIWAGWKIRNNF
jgi:hypothetical protein